MLDYSSICRSREGVVRFHRKSAGLVSPLCGIYQIVIVPFSYGRPDQNPVIDHYLDVVARRRVDGRRSFRTEVKIATKGLALYMEQIEESVNGTFLENDSFVRHAVTFFPPFYIGKATNIQSRFVDHVYGTCSEVQSMLAEFELADYLAFFRWHVSPLPTIDALEALLLQSHRPILNKQLR